MTKTSRIFRVAEILDDILTDVADETIVEKYCISFKQLGRIYTKLFFGGFIGKADLTRRIELRHGKDASYIPLADISETEGNYECLACGFSSDLHFSQCPHCKEINLRRLTREHAAVLRLRSQGFHLGTVPT